MEFLSGLVSSSPLPSLRKELLNQVPEGSFESDRYVPDLKKGPLNKKAEVERPFEDGVAFNTMFKAKDDPSLIQGHAAIPEGVDAPEQAFLMKVLPGFSPDVFGQFVERRSRQVYTEKGKESVDSVSYGLEGLFSYIHLCWAREKGFDFMCSLLAFTLA